MVLTLPVTQYPIKIASILRFWATNFLIPTMDTEFMGGFRCTSEGDDSLCLKALSKKNLILTHYMLSAWWLQIMYVLGHNFIHLEVMKQVLVMNNNIMALGYTYDKRRLNNPPDIF